ncbi:MAG: DUF2798 domain-containing protein [Aminivibrio sp.]|jgi:hypothetical protein
MKISSKYYNTVLSCLAAVIISVPIAFVMVVINLGFVAGFMPAFLKSAAAGVAISVPLANVGIPLAQKITDGLVEKKN